MRKIFIKPEERSFTVSVARARFVWLMIAALLLPIAASLAQGHERREEFQRLLEDSERSEIREVSQK